MYPCDPISFNCMKIRGEASYYYAEIIKKKEFVKEYDFFFFLICVFLISGKLKKKTLQWYVTCIWFNIKVAPCFVYFNVTST